MGIESMLAKVLLWKIILKQHIFCVCMGVDLSQDSNGHLEVKAVVNQTWWHIIPALERLDPEYLKFDSSVGYIISVSKPELCGKALSQTQKTKSNRFWQNLPNVMANFKSVFMFLSLWVSKKHIDLVVNGSHCRVPRCYARLPWYWSNT